MQVLSVSVALDDYMLSVNEYAAQLFQWYTQKVRLTIEIHLPANVHFFEEGLSLSAEGAHVMEK